MVVVSSRGSVDLGENPRSDIMDSILSLSHFPPTFFTLFGTGHEDTKRTLRT